MTKTEIFRKILSYPENKVFFPIVNKENLLIIVSGADFTEGETKILDDFYQILEEIENLPNCEVLRFKRNEVYKLYNFSIEVIYN